MGRNAGDGGTRSLLLRLPRHPAIAAGPTAEHDVLRHRHGRNEMGILMDGGDTNTVCGGRVGLQSYAVDRDLAAVRRIEAGHKLDKGRFPGTVFAEQRRDFTGPYVEIDIVEGQNTREPLCDATSHQHLARRVNRLRGIERCLEHTHDKPLAVPAGTHKNCDMDFPPAKTTPLPGHARGGAQTPPMTTTLEVAFQLVNWSRHRTSEIFSPHPGLHIRALWPGLVKPLPGGLATSRLEVQCKNRCISHGITSKIEI